MIIYTEKGEDNSERRDKERKTKGVFIVDLNCGKLL